MNKETERINEKEYEVEGYAYCSSQAQHCLTDCWFMHNSVASVND